MNTRNQTHARPPSIVETERLLLRPPSLEDAFGLMALARGDEPFARSTVGDEPNTLEGACTAIARMLADRRQGLGAWWVVVEKRSEQVVGLAGFSARLGRQDLLATLASDATGRGFAIEAVRALAEFDLRAPAATERQAVRKPEHVNASWYWRCKATRAARAMPRCA